MALRNAGRRVEAKAELQETLSISDDFPDAQEVQDLHLSL
jgi:hypothetical protein